MTSCSKVIDLKLKVYEKIKQSPADQLIYLSQIALEDSQTLESARVKANNVDNPLILIVQQRMETSSSTGEPEEKLVPHLSVLFTWSSTSRLDWRPCDHRAGQKAQHHTTAYPAGFCHLPRSRSCAKSVDPERIRTNFKCLDIKLSQEDIQKLNSIDKDQHYIRTTGWLVK
uniref:Uncharacterized protein n=1 Tax=Ditylenchus dipsaci TaxID=166011 RepID=A0A915EBW6_9BILA